ncbi:DNA helicase PcrA [Gehongia tenuis]|uniref:ATP-dependent DNA helicase n=1 Tax=Gehongia tenuis TaxID=2763655 RepID=A0A926D3V3_9FIRM|nr:DNA helicase PcrA [Gehongia tenuis]MBC8530756.1 DNA helicase PcrA [Gehongia tenuis]
MELTQLNEPQRQAVLQMNGPLLIIAGAGSGKTRVLTYRIAHLMEEGVSPYQILAITFTNKAAREMKTRIEALVPGDGEKVWAGTFHSVCVRILRREIHQIGYERSFTIYDSDDQTRLVTAIMKDLDIGRDITPREVRSKISEAKNNLVGPDEFFDHFERDFRREKIQRVYRVYEKRLKESNALDFDDLLVKTLEVFSAYPDVLSYYQERFRYILVDEYQDTNPVQYMLVKLLAARYRNLCVVGDDDQSIYGWRGADIKNILGFNKDFPEAVTIRLEQNYRSTQKILDAANHIIQHNARRKEKKLWTDRGEGQKLRFYRGDNEHDEAEYIASEIARLSREKACTYGGMAVLYRMNAQSRVLEEMLMRFGIPYRIYGGTRFYERKEVKDALAYLRAVVNPADEISLTRIINEPKRGIGQSTVAQLAAMAEEQAETLFGVVVDIDGETGLPARAKQKVGEFAELITALLMDKEQLPLSEFVETMLQKTGLWAQYEKDPSDEAQTRLENLKELLGAVQEFEKSDETATLESFLENVALVSDIDGLEEVPQAVSLLTLHSAKGLEFPVVFIAGMEEGIFPMSRAMTDDDQMEEERRLCYVGVTRAEDQLYLTCAQQRMLMGMTQYNPPSRFLAEIPGELIEGRLVRSQPAKVKTDRMPAFTPSFMKKPKNDAVYAMGMKVEHQKFGRGTVIAITGHGEEALVTVAFEGQGVKKLMASLAPMKPVQ